LQTAIRHETVNINRRRLTDFGPFRIFRIDIENALIFDRRFHVERRETTAIPVADHFRRLLPRRDLEMLKTFSI
jgi:hypothetical protein